MDEADIASEQEEFARSEALFRARKPLRLPPRGHCYFCSEPTASLFCDVDCRRDYEREHKIKQQQQAQQ